MFSQLRTFTMDGEYSDKEIFDIEKELRRLFPFTEYYVSLKYTDGNFYFNGKQRCFDYYYLPLLKLLLKRKHPERSTSWIEYDTLFFRYGNGNDKRELNFAMRGRFSLNNFSTIEQLKQCLNELLELCVPADREILRCLQDFMEEDKK